MKLWFDTETYSEVPLKNGTAAYFEHEATEIIIAQWAVDDGPVHVEDLTENGGGMPYRVSPALLAHLRDPNVEVWAHNSYFDRQAVRACWGIDVPIHRWRDTMVQGMVHGLSGGLAELGKIVGLAIDKQKDQRGRRLIQKFCQPQGKRSVIRRHTRATDPDDWEEFLQYAEQDIVTLRELAAALPSWNYTGQELTLWHLDQVINDRGFHVDLDLARGAVAAVAREQARLVKTMQDLTGGLVPTQGAALREYVKEHCGVDLADMRAATLREHIAAGEIPDNARDILAIRLEAVRTSTAKYHTLLRSTSRDSRMRGTLQFSGAQRTRRWAGRLFQPQNNPRPRHWMTHDDIEAGIESLKAGVADLVWDDVMALTTDTVRGCIEAELGRKLVVSDLSNIEGRKIAWLAGEEWKLQAFRDYDAGIGADLYKVAYAKAFKVEPGVVSKEQRQVGKVKELAFGYEGGVGAVLTFAKSLGIDLENLAQLTLAAADDELIDEAYRFHEWAVKMKITHDLPPHQYVAFHILKVSWRAAHPAIVTFWAELQNAFVVAVQNPGTVVRVGPLAFKRDGSWLRIRLPGGGYLCYLQPKAEWVAEPHEDDDPDTEPKPRLRLSYMGVNQQTKAWGRIYTYGGKLAENITQACARDVMAENMPAIEEAGYRIVLTVHDEVITEPDDSPDFTPDGLSALLATVPKWAPGLPLAAAGFEAYRYRKD